VRSNGSLLVVVATVAGSLLGDKARKWGALLTSFAIMFAIAANGDPDAQDWMIAVLNSFLVFATATGINSGMATVTNQPSSRKNDPAYKDLATHLGKTDALFKDWF